MKTIILCGGYGTRLKEETEFKPKPMVFVANQPILWYIMKHYAHFGFNEFILALGYKADYIKDFFLNQKAFTSDFSLNTKTHEVDYHFENSKNNDEFKITFVDTGLNTLPGERILKCQKYLTDENFMVTYGDGVSNIDISKLSEFHSSRKTLATITGVHPRSRFGMMKIRGNYITNLTEKPILNDWVNGGFMVFNKKALKFIKKGETEHPGLQRLANKKQLSIYKHNGFWFCVDTYKEVSTLNEMWKQKTTPWKVWK